MALNNFGVTDFVSRTLGTFLSQNSVFLGLSYNQINEFTEFGGDGRGYKPGQAVNIKIPGYPTVTNGLATTAESVVDKLETYTATVEDIFNVSYDIDIRESMMDVSGNVLAFTENPYAKEKTKGGKYMTDNYAIPSGRAIQGAIDTHLGTKCRNAAYYTTVQHPNDLTTINSYADISAVEELFEDLGMPAERYAIMNPKDAKGVFDSLQNMFNTRINTQITERALVGGSKGGLLAGFELYRSNTILTTPTSDQYASNATSTGVTVDSVATDGSTITFDGFTPNLTPAVTAGTLIAIQSVNLINGVNKKVLDKTLVICASEDANSDGGGLCTVVLSEPLVVTGLHQNVNSFPANGAAALVFPGHNNNYFFIPMGIISNHLPLDMIRGADNSRYVSEEDNISCQTYIQGLVPNGVNTIRMSSFIPTKAIPKYLVNLPSPLRANQ